MAMLNNQMVTWQCIRVHPIFGQPPSHRLCLKQRLRLRNNPAGHGLGFTSESGESNFMMLHRMGFQGKIYGQSFQKICLHFESTYTTSSRPGLILFGHFAPASVQAPACPWTFYIINWFCRTGQASVSVKRLSILSFSAWSSLASFSKSLPNGLKKDIRNSRITLLHMVQKHMALCSL